ncbi:hypothetical protein EJD97_023210, partial [Solanum chilense]
WTTTTRHSGVVQPHSSSSTHLYQTDSNSQTIALPGLPIILFQENYYLWQSTVFSVFEAFDLEGHFDGTSAPPITILTTTHGTYESTSDPSFTTWKKQGKVFLLWLKTTISHSVITYI